MFSLFARYHRHKDLEEAIISLSREVSTIRLENASIRAQFAVAAREKHKINRESIKNELPEDVRDILAQLPDGELETVLNSEGHAIYSKNSRDLNG